MSTGLYFVPERPHRTPLQADVLGELLHSLSQPLTGLRCSLELSLELSLGGSLEGSLGETAEWQCEMFEVALQQTEKAIGMVQLMREYLDAEGQPGSAAFSTALLPALRSVIEELTSIAAVRDVQLRLAGACTTILPVPESRLRLALQYLIASVIETQTAGSRVTFTLTERAAETVLRIEIESEKDFLLATHPRATPGSALGRVRQAIASRVLENAGALVVNRDADDAAAGLILRIPRRVALPTGSLPIEPLGRN